MRILLFLAVALSISSCSGWSKGGENAYIDSCKQEKEIEAIIADEYDETVRSSIDCDCAMKLTKKKYPNESDFNKKGGDDMELALEIAKKCYTVYTVK